jgi:hypothetical protein
MAWTTKTKFLTKPNIFYLDTTKCWTKSTVASEWNKSGMIYHQVRKNKQFSLRKIQSYFLSVGQLSSSAHNKDLLCLCACTARLKIVHIKILFKSFIFLFVKKETAIISCWVYKEDFYLIKDIWTHLERTLGILNVFLKRAMVFSRWPVRWVKPVP